MVRRGIRRGIRRSFVRLSRAAVISMSAAAGGVALATIAARENVSREEAEGLMEDLVSEGAVKKETRNGETYYVATRGAGASTQVQPSAQAAKPSPAGAAKFCRNCGAQIPRESKFCEECGTRLEA